MITGMGLFAALVAISVIDIRTRRIPDLLSLSLMCAGLIQAAWAVQRGAAPTVLTDSIIGAASGYLVFAAIGAAFFRMRGQEGLGLGDAKLLAAAGAWLGWQMLPAVVLIAALGGLAQMAVAGRLWPARAADRSLAFGPWLALAFFSLWILTAR
ncbi:A24 family peptidase [Paracoccus sp. WLY502]|uniref:prepilin peptidase n=1 Tax=Paracoccus yibinensis TaxID=3068891 RepID=UPI002796B294|nr:A24 family peptidase [Paracoccus sp. WLY502]MDQ1901660.1 A24 family peptidase [Paracoccus sp. WLY502]